MKLVEQRELLTVERFSDCSPLKITGYRTHYGRTYAWIDGRSDGPTDGTTDNNSFRDARTHLKSSFFSLVF